MSRRSMPAALVVTLRRRIAAGVLVVVMMSAMLAGVFGSVSWAVTVSGDTYVQTVCTQVASFDDTVSQNRADVDQAAATFKATPTQTNAIAVRDALATVLDQNGDAIDEMVLATEDAGIPDINHGAQFAKAVVANMRAAAKLFHAAATQAAAIDVSNASRFAAGVQRLDKKITTAQKRFQQQAKRDPAFKNVSSTLQPLVVFLTTDAPRCPGT
jgi:hypothetical protein